MTARSDETAGGRSGDPAERWPAGAATGVGSLPGTDMPEALQLVFDELPDLPHLPELPARGPGSELTGRTAVLLVDTPVDRQPSGWRLVPRPGVDARRAADLLARDLDALVEVAGDYAGPLKLQAGGPWTLAATVEMTRGGPALGDVGARRDLADALAEGLAGHLRQVAGRLPGARLLVQLDEPALPAVLAGAVPTASGFAAVPAVPDAEVQDRLAVVLAAVTRGGGWPLVHCCARDAPVRLLADAGARGVGVDLTRPEAVSDQLAEVVDGGVRLFAGVLPALGPGVPPSPGAVADPVRERWADWGFEPARLPRAVVLTPACGLAGASVGWARSALRLVRQAGRLLTDAPEPTRRSTDRGSQPARSGPLGSG